MESSNASSETSFTFKVDPVDLCKEVPSMETVKEILRKKGIFDVFARSVEDCSHRQDMNANYVNCGIPGMIAAIHTAYNSHYALSLSVSDFIILIGQGLGTHINNAVKLTGQGLETQDNTNAEKVRKHFVDHEGTQAIEVVRDDFVLAGQNDWSTVFGEFAEEIKKRVKADVYDVIIDDTSVATAASRIVSEIALMDAMKSYFKYRVSTKCGIPEITLEGRPEDWQKLKDKVAKLVEMNKDDCLDLKWWLDQLVPVVEKICEAGIERKVDVAFWKGIYKYEQPGSGGPYFGGWIIKLFPYFTKDLYGGISLDSRNSFSEITSDMIPKQVCEVPFIWKCMGKDISMKFSAGFLGAEFNKDLCMVKPASFWCVTKDRSAQTVTNT